MNINLNLGPVAIFDPFNAEEEFRELSLEDRVKETVALRQHLKQCCSPGSILDPDPGLNLILINI